MKKTINHIAALALASTLALSACSSDDKATFDPSEDDKQSSQSAKGSTGSASESPEAIEPAKTQTIEVNETKSASTDRAAITLTVHKVVVNDYYIESEVTIVNDGPKPVIAWRTGPKVFDDRGREYEFQSQAGEPMVELQGGEGVNAVLVHAGRLDPEARQLTLDFTGANFMNDELWSQVTFDVPVGEK